MLHSPWPMHHRKPKTMSLRFSSKMLGTKKKKNAMITYVPGMQQEGSLDHIAYSQCLTSHTLISATYGF